MSAPSLQTRRGAEYEPKGKDLLMQPLIVRPNTMLADKEPTTTPAKIADTSDDLIECLVSMDVASASRV
jgi:hypothetical protein